MCDSFWDVDGRPPKEQKVKNEQPTTVSSGRRPFMVAVRETGPGRGSPLPMAQKKRKHRGRHSVALTILLCHDRY